MHDEAVTTWTDQINQMTVGHRFILDNFGVVPTKGWQIDPFGIAQRCIAHCRQHFALAAPKQLHVSLELTGHHCRHFTGSSAATPTLFARMGNNATTSSKHLPQSATHTQRPKLDAQQGLMALSRTASTTTSSPCGRTRLTWSSHGEPYPKVQTATVLLAHAVQHVPSHAGAARHGVTAG